MEEKILEKYQKLIEKGAVLDGVIKLVEFREDLDSDIVLVDLEDVQAVIKREDFDIKDRGESLVKYISKKIKFVPVSIEEDGTLSCSRKKVKEYARDLLIQKLNNGEEFEGKVVHIEKFGAYLNVKGVSVFLKNIDFSEDHTTIEDKFKLGDTIKVKALRVSKSNKIFVQAVEKFCNPTSVDISSFNPNQVMHGTIRTIKAWGCYVCIAPNLDALASVPEVHDTEVTEGMKVLIKIKKVDSENGRVRGKIIRILDSSDEFELD